MKLFDFFKKKKKEKAKEEVKKEVKKEKKRPLEKKREVKVEQKIKPQAVKIKRKASQMAAKVLDSPHITEKAAILGEANRYVFKVFKDANKNEIKKAIEDNYGVDVVAVKIINVSRKQRRLGRQKGWKKGYKKAIVKVKEGQKIEILPR